MEDNKVVIKGEFQGSKAYFRAIEKEKSKLDCVGVILKTFKRKRKSRK